MPGEFSTAVESSVDKKGECLVADYHRTGNLGRRQLAGQRSPTNFINNLWNN